MLHPSPQSWTDGLASRAGCGPLGAGWNLQLARPCSERHSGLLRRSPLLPPPLCSPSMCAYCAPSPPSLCRSLSTLLLPEVISEVRGGACSCPPLSCCCCERSLSGLHLSPLSLCPPPPLYARALPLSLCSLPPPCVHALSLLPAAALWHLGNLSHQPLIISDSSFEQP